MIKKLYTIIAVLLFTVSAFAQAPQKMSYQAVIRSASNDLLTAQTIPMQISILKGDSSVYTETQTTVTNSNGLISIEIGTGTTSDDFSSIDWANGIFFIETQIDIDGGGYDITTTSQLLSVPYAIFTKTAANGIPSGGTNGQVLTISGGIAIWTTPTPACTDTFYFDKDSDGYGNPNDSFVACSLPNGYVIDNTDCNDNDETINPDNVWYLDADGDNYAVSSTVQCTSPGTGYTTTVLPITDCNDNDETINSDNIWYLDADGDNYAISSTTQCGNPGTGYTTTVLPITDCNDNDETINPDTIWYFGVDDDNDTFIGSVISEVACENPGGYSLIAPAITDCNDVDSIVNIDQTWYIDGDGDGYGGSSEVSCHRPTNGFLLSELTGTSETDCNDNDPSEFPGQAWYIDNDGDGYGSLVEVSCNRPTNLFSLSELTGIDCNDNCATCYPGAPQIYGDTKDNNCDDITDELPKVGDLRVGGVVFWIDPLYPDRGLVCALSNFPTQVQWGCRGTDLPILENIADEAPWVPSGLGSEIGDGANNTGLILHFCPTAPAALAARSYGPDWFLPSTGELKEMYENQAALIAANKFRLFSPNLIWSSTESTDAKAWGHSGSSSFPLSKNQPLNIRVVRAFPDCNVAEAQTWYIDADSDGYGGASEVTCYRPTNGFLLSELTGIGDCNDNNPSEFPGQTWYKDSDGDGYGGLSQVSCLRPTGLFLLSELTGIDDCNDVCVTCYPNAPQIHGDGIDNNCDGLKDELPKVGDLRAGGVVFWVNPISPDHGLVCAMSDYPSNVYWGCEQDLLLQNITSEPTSGPGANIGDGTTNTDTILFYCPTSPAALAARSYGPDWYLPSINELIEINDNSEIIEAAHGFSSFNNSIRYWSSTEYDILKVWTMSLSSFGDVNYYSHKGTALNKVRAVRAF